MIIYSRGIFVVMIIDGSDIFVRWIMDSNDIFSLLISVMIVVRFDCIIVTMPMLVVLEIRVGLVFAYFHILGGFYDYVAEVSKSS